VQQVDMLRDPKLSLTGYVCVGTAARTLNQ